MEKILVTEEIWQKGLSRNGGVSSRQAKLFGVTIRNNKGWKREIIGHWFPKDIIDKYISLKDRHLKKETKGKKGRCRIPFVLK